jgi:hypothetical protein
VSRRAKESDGDTKRKNGFAMARILNRMVKRLLPLLIAVAVAGAPAALAACEIACGSSTGHAGMSHSAMSEITHDGAPACHDGATMPGPRVAPLPRTCGHDGADQPQAPGVGANQASTIAVPVAVLSGSDVPSAGPESIIGPPSLSRDLPVRTSVRAAMPLRI